MARARRKQNRVIHSKLSSRNHRGAGAAGTSDASHSHDACEMGLLKNLNPILTADLLHVLRSMGHGDVLVVCDCNFPAVEVASKVWCAR